MSDDLIEYRSLDVIGAELKVEVAAAEAAFAEAVNHALRAGELLIEAKAKCRHGEWTPWLEAHGVNPRSARGYMQLAKSGRADELRELGLRGALAELASPSGRKGLPASNQEIRTAMTSALERFSLAEIRHELMLVDVERRAEELMEARRDWRAAVHEVYDRLGGTARDSDLREAGLLKNGETIVIAVLEGADAQVGWQCADWILASVPSLSEGEDVEDYIDVDDEDIPELLASALGRDADDDLYNVERELRNLRRAAVLFPPDKRLVEVAPWIHLRIWQDHQ